MLLDLLLAHGSCHGDGAGRDLSGRCVRSWAQARAPSTCQATGRRHARQRYAGRLFQRRCLQALYARNGGGGHFDGWLRHGAAAQKSAQCFGGGLISMPPMVPAAGVAGQKAQTQARAKPLMPAVVGHGLVKVYLDTPDRDAFYSRIAATEASRALRLAWLWRTTVAPTIKPLPDTARRRAMRAAISHVMDGPHHPRGLQITMTERMAKPRMFMRIGLAAHPFFYRFPSGSGAVSPISFRGNPMAPSVLCSALFDSFSNPRWTRGPAVFRQRCAPRSGACCLVFSNGVVGPQ